MSSLDITLDKFVTKIPLCQANTSWDKIVTALYSSPRGMIAVVDSNFCPLGILESHKLLATIAQENINSRIGAEKNAQLCSESLVPPQTNKLTSLISRITSLSSQIKIKDLLSLLNNQKSLIAEQHYFIVDATGIVQGILDIPKILQHMSQANANVDEVAAGSALKGRSNFDHKLDRQSFVNNLDQLSETTGKNLFSLLEQIPLPLMLHNAEGNICYQNPVWNQHLKPSQKFSGSNGELNLNLTKQLTNFKEHPKFVTSSGLAFPSAIFSQNLDGQKSAISTECYCPIQDNGWHSLFIDSQSIINNIPQTFSNREHPPNSTQDFYEQIADNSNLITQNDSDLDWHYMRFPIQLAVQNLAKTPHNQSLPKYWLVLGTQLSSTNDRQIHQATAQKNQNNLEQVRGLEGCQLPPSSDLDKLRRLQNEFMVNISHDLKSPLTAIIGLSSLLREEKLGSLNARQIRYLDLIYRGGRQLMGIVTDLLDITSLVKGKLRLKLETIELEKLCHQAYQKVVTKLEAVQDSHKNRPLALPQFQFNLESGSSEVIADRLRLNQILTRLLENAVKSTPAEGAIGIRIERWAEWVAIIVWDTGRGIAEMFQASLLEEMFEPDNFLTSPEKTTGLGLILAQQLAQLHGGDISFSSEINHGSEFTLLLPANPLKTLNQEDFCLEEELTCSENHHNQSTLVLIVETSPVRIKDLTANLNKLGYHAAIAHNQKEALYKASHLKPSKIILNNEFIEFSAQNILATLKSEPQTSHIPLLLTCQNLPCLDYLYFQADYLLLSPSNKINPETLAKHFPPLTSQNSYQNYCQGKRLTMLRLCLTANNREKTGTSSEIDLLFDNPSFNLCHHIIESDSIEQANTLARIWKIDTIIWDSSNLDLSLELLRSLSTFPNLVQIPIVTLDEPTTAAANQFDNLTVFPCLVSINEQNITELMQVIQSAAMNNN